MLNKSCAIFHLYFSFTRKKPKQIYQLLIFVDWLLNSFIEISSHTFLMATLLKSKTFSNSEDEFKIFLSSSCLTRGQSSQNVARKRKNVWKQTEMDTDLSVFNEGKQKYVMGRRQKIWAHKITNLYLLFLFICFSFAPQKIFLVGRRTRSALFYPFGILISFKTPGSLIVRVSFSWVLP